jgi:hypothetical protein
LHQSYGERSRYDAAAYFVDPLGFDAGDSNLSRYVNNAPTNGTDPSGEDPPIAPPGSAGAAQGKTKLASLATNGPSTWFPSENSSVAQQVIGPAASSKTASVAGQQQVSDPLEKFMREGAAFARGVIKAIDGFAQAVSLAWDATVNEKYPSGPVSRGGNVKFLIEDMGQFLEPYIGVADVSQYVYSKVVDPHFEPSYITATAKAMQADPANAGAIFAERLGEALGNVAIQGLIEVAGTICSAVVFRSGPRGVVAGRHNANVMVRNAEGNVVSHQRLVSGSMTPAEQSLGFPNGSLASHTEARAVRNIPLRPGDTMVITGQNPPCPRCRGVMNQAAGSTGANIIYRWRAGGVTQTWTAGG